MPQNWIPPDYASQEEIDPLPAAKKTLSKFKVPDYATEDDEVVEPVATKPLSAFDKVYNFANKAVTDYLPEEYRPSSIVSKFTKPLEEYGESSDDLSHKAALWGGTYADALTGAAEGMTSPLQLGLTALTAGAPIAKATGALKVAKALEFPGQAAAGTMVYHGGKKAFDPNLTAGERIAGVGEAALGAFGMRGSSKELKSSELPTETKPTKVESKFPEANRFDELALKTKEGSITADEIIEAQKLNRKLNSFAKTKSVLEKRAESISADEPAGEIPIAEEQNIRTNPQTGETFAGDSPRVSAFGEKPKVKVINDESGRFLGYEPIVEDRPSQFNVNKSIEEGKPVEFTKPDYAEEIPQAIPAKATEPNAIRKYMDESGEIAAEPVKPAPTEESQLLSDYNNTLKEGEIPSFKGFQEFKAAKVAEPITEPAVPQATFSHFDADGKPKFHLSDTKSDVGVEKLQELGLEIPEVPSEIQQIPAPIKAMLDAAGIDSTGMDVTTAVNKARELKGMESAGSGSSEPPITTTEPALESAPDPISRLKAAMQQSAEARPAQEAINAKERSIRAGKISAIETPGLAGHYERKGALAGEFNKIPIEHQLTSDDVNGLVNNIQKSDLLPFQKLNAGDAILKLGSGQSVTPYEAKILGKVFGNDFEELIHLHGGLGGIPGGGRQLFNEAVNLPKTMESILDLSASLKQGLPFITTPEYWKSFSTMLRNEKDFNSFQDSLVARPNYELGHESGLYLSELGKIGQREEQFLSKAIDKVPVFGTVKKGSERAYVGFLNKLRADLFDNYTKYFEGIGHELRDVNGKPTKLMTDTADFINNFTGRGSLDLSKVTGIPRKSGNFGNLEKIAVELNAGIFSPRLLTSRLTTLNPVYYVKLHPALRLSALRTVLSIVGASLLTDEILKKMGATVSNDPTNTDYRKAKFGNTRLDSMGGYQQPIVAATRFIKGQQTSVNGRVYDLNKSKFPDPTRLSVVGNFGRKKESPILKFADDLMLGDQAFKPSGFGKMVSDKMGGSETNARAINLFTPMLVNDLIDLKKENPDLIPGITLGALVAFGDSLQTMAEPEPKSAFRMGGMTAPKP